MVIKPAGLEKVLGVYGRVSSTGTVTVEVTNPTAAAIDPAAGEFTVLVTRIRA